MEKIVTKEEFLQELVIILEQFKKQLKNDKSDSPVKMTVDEIKDGIITITLQQVI